MNSPEQLNAPSTTQLLGDNLEVLSEEKGIETKPLSPRDLLTFAKSILLAIAILFAFAALTEVIWPTNAIFETCKTVLPSVTTLVIGYYFGSAAK